MIVEQNGMKRSSLSLGELKVSKSTTGVVGCVCYYRLVFVSGGAKTAK